MNKRLLGVIFLAFLMAGCTVPELGPINGASNGPRSNFVPPRAIITVNAGERLQLESYHLSDRQLGSLKISVNGQPIRSEATGGEPTFPSNLATLEVLVWPSQADPAPFILSSATCKATLNGGEARVLNPVELAFPSKSWSVCHVWTGNVPGIYDVSIQAFDRDQRPGEIAVQRIEVIGAR